MGVDEKEFFREATLRICGSLEIEKALWRCFMYIRDFIPADTIMLSHMVPKMGVQEFMAEATIDGGRRQNLTISLPPETWALIRNRDNPQDVMVIDKPEEHPVVKHSIRLLGRKNSSLIIVRLIIDGQYLGGCSVIARGGQKFTNEHARLLSLLKEPFAIALSNFLRFREVHDLKEQLVDDNKYLQNELRQITGEEIIGSDFGLKGVMDLVRHVAPQKSLVTLLGETGTGKEVIARAIHNLSPRREGPFIKVNCGAIPDTLMDSELFGHEKGAFTGAHSLKRGRFERANKGTIFLDEIGELSPDAQVRLLRVLQEREIERVGGNKPVTVDIRVIAATHRDLQSMIKKNRFREDLFFRLQVFPISIPPLRKRIEDIPALVQYFILKKSREMGLQYISIVAEGAMDRLMEYQWPGNVRELENAVERALILSKGKSIDFTELTTQNEQTGNAAIDILEDRSYNLESVLRQHISRVLKVTRGKVGGDQGAAMLLGINPSTLRHKMRKLGITFGRKAKELKI